MDASDFQREIYGRGKKVKEVNKDTGEFSVSARS